MQTNHTVTLVPALDLSDENQRIIQILIERTHTGRWPLWRSLGMRHVGGLLFEAVQWSPRRRTSRPQYSLLRWDIADLGVSWQDMPSKTAAIEALEAAVPRLNAHPTPALALSIHDIPRVD